MPSYQITRREAGPSQVIPLDLKRYAAGVGLLLTINGVLTCTVEMTGDQVQKPGYTPSQGNWNNHDSLVNMTASANGNLEFPVSALRLNVTSYTNGSATLAIIQSEG